MTDRNQIIIGDDEVIELPFHMISSASFAPDEKNDGAIRTITSGE